jgi:predicted DNA-binding protein (MmcQ/YjbR family)
VAASRGSIRDRVRTFALSLPEAYEDHPWGESVVKVNKKIFVFLGADHGSEGRMMSVKVPDSNAQALMVPGAEPTGYGLGRGGWVTVPLTRGAPPLAVLTDWVEESYRAVAPKRFAQRLDRDGESPAPKVSAGRRKRPRP